MKRTLIQPIPIRLLGPAQQNYAIKTIQNLPLDPDRPLQVLIREEPRKRKVDANAAYWAGPLADIARQAWHNSRQYRAEEWHEGFKALFLPDPDAPDFDPTHVANPETYRKWSINPVTGDRQCVGSTTWLTDKGMHIFRLQVEAFAAQTFGVVFTTREEPEGRPTSTKIAS